MVRYGLFGRLILPIESDALSGGFANAAVNMKRPKFSLGSWAFSFGPFENNPWSFEEFVRYCADAGYDGIEINGFHPHPHPEVYNTDLKCRELRKSIDGNGLGISGYAPDLREVPPTRVATQTYLETFEKALKFCERMGIATLRVDSISAPEPLPIHVYDQRFGQLVKTWRAASALCEMAGVKLVWEFEPGFSMNKPSEIVAVVEGVDHPNFKVLFDTCHAYMCADLGSRQAGPREVLPGGMLVLAELLSGHIGHFHLIDSDGTLHDEETSTHTPFGEGLIDFKEVLRGMKEEVLPLEWWCFDFCFCPTTEKDGRAAIPFVETLLKEIMQ